MTEITFHQIAQGLLKKEVEVITTRGNFNGRLRAVGKDVIVLEARGRMDRMELTIRIEQIVAIHREERIPRGPFGFNPMEFGAEEEHRESSSHRER